MGLEYKDSFQVRSKDLMGPKLTGPLSLRQAALQSGAVARGPRL